jgi:hypothetical protein
MVLMILGLLDPDPPLTSKTIKKDLDFYFLRRLNGPDLEPLSSVPKYHGSGTLQKTKVFYLFPCVSGSIKHSSSSSSYFSKK